MLKNENGSWTEKTKNEVIHTYLVTGNLALTARIMDVPEETIRYWRKQDWWDDTVREIRHSGKVELSSKMKKIVEASIAVIEDRIVNGDFVFDQKSGEVVRKPVNLKDAHKVAIDMVDRQGVLEQEADGGVSSNEGKNIASSLEKLAEAFKTFAEKNQVKE
jgi:transposase-like protein